MITLIRSIRYLVFFTIVFLILSFNINNRPLFNHIRDAGNDYFKVFLSNSKKVGQQLFSNSIPKGPLAENQNKEEGPLPKQIEDEKGLANL